MKEVKDGFTLKTARERKGLKQAEAAKRIGISVDPLGNYERGKAFRPFRFRRK